MHHSSVVTGGNSSRIRAGSMAFLIGYFAIMATSHARPASTRQTGEPCAACHTSEPDRRLTSHGDAITPDNMAAAGQESRPPDNVVVRTALLDFPGDLSGRVTQSAPGLKMTLPRASSDRPGYLSQDFVEFSGRDIPARGNLAHTISGHGISFKPLSSADLHAVEIERAWPHWNQWPSIMLDQHLALTTSVGRLSQWDCTLEQPGTGSDTAMPWNDFVNSDRLARKITGADEAQAAGTGWIDDSSSYSRVAVRKNLERHFLQIGDQGVDTSMLPGVDQFVRASGMQSDSGAGTIYHFMIEPTSNASDVVSLHATLQHESRSLGDGNRVFGATNFSNIDRLHADASWSFANTVTPSIQYFRTMGSVDGMRYYGAGGRPNNAGVIAEVAYIPQTVAGSPMGFVTLRFAAQYVAYTEFNGATRGASANNAVFLSLWGAMHF